MTAFGLVVLFTNLDVFDGDDRVSQGLPQTKSALSTTIVGSSRNTCFIVSTTASSLAALAASSLSIRALNSIIFF